MRRSVSLPMHLLRASPRASLLQRLEGALQSAGDRGFVRDEEKDILPELGNGIPIRKGMAIGVEYRAREDITVELRGLFISRRGKIRTTFGEFSTTTTTFAATNPAIPHTFDSDGWLYGLSPVIKTGTVPTTPFRVWIEAGLLSGSSLEFPLFLGWFYRSHIPSYPPIKVDPPLALHDRGAIFTYFNTLTNGAGASGDHVYTVAVAAGSRLEIFQGSVLNGDTVSRNLNIVVDDGTNIVGGWIPQPVAVTAANRYGLPPAVAGSQLSRFPRLVLVGPMRAVFTLAAVAVSEDSALGFEAELFGASPTITETGPAGVTVGTEASGVRDA